MMFGAMGNPDHDASIRIIHTALDAGINFVDTADVYSHGESEEIVGKAIKGRRDDVVLATKLHYPMGEDPNHRGNSRRWIMTAVEQSLRRLQTDHLDLYQVHRPDPSVDLEETLSALSAAARSARSVHPPTRLQRSWRRSGSPHGAASNASEPSNRRTRSSTAAPNRRCCPHASDTASGHWSGARSARACSPDVTAKAQRATTHRSGSQPQYFGDELNLDVVEQLIPLADQAGLPMTHLAMAFAIAHPGVTSAIIGPRTMDQLDDLLAGADVALDDEVLDRIDEIAPPGTDAGPNPVAYTPPAISRVDLRRRSTTERPAA
jgi:aryl-alcohol dehydrogenase-like predicted oxidoreductase